MTPGSAPEWYEAPKVADLLHVTRRHLQRLLTPHRDRCHLARDGRHPRLVLWVPALVVRQLREERRSVWRSRARARW